MPHAAAICVALTHSLWASSEEAICDCVCVVCMVETSSDGRERVRVKCLCPVHYVQCVGPRGGALGGARDIVENPSHVRHDQEGKRYPS